MKRTLLFMTCMLASLTMSAIERDNFYYYQGNKIPLTLNENKVVVSIPKDCDDTSKRIRANVSFLITIKDEVFDIFIIYRSDFEKLTSQSFWEEDANSEASCQEREIDTKAAREVDEKAFSRSHQL